MILTSWQVRPRFDQPECQHAVWYTVAMKTRKVTLVLPESLLEQAQKQTGQGITPTVREGLELLTRRQAYDSVRRFRGKLNLSWDKERMREDR